MLTSFCSFRLNTTCVMIGKIDALSSFVAVVLFSVAISMARQLAEAIINKQQKMPYTEEQVQSFITIICVINVVFALIHFACSLLLILGATKKRHLLLLPWLTNLMIFLVVVTVEVVVAIVFETAMQISFILLFFVSIFFVGIQAFNFYIWYAVYSHYKELQASPDQRQLS